MQHIDLGHDLSRDDQDLDQIVAADRVNSGYNIQLHGSVSNRPNDVPQVGASDIPSIEARNIPGIDPRDIPSLQQAVGVLEAQVIPNDGNVVFHAPVSDAIRQLSLRSPSVPEGNGTCIPFAATVEPLSLD